MKIQCDVCEKGEASVYCIADEAALCNSCDHRVHHANKLANKHQRFSLIQPPAKQAPVCDICQERRAFLFCQQDRAILCRECDIPIHKANEHTEKHNRFLLTGVKLSATSALYSSSSSTPSPSSSSSKSETAAAASAGSDAVPNSQIRRNKHSVSVTNHPCSTVTKADSKAAVASSAFVNTTTTAGSTELVSDDGQMMNTSSIAEYLIETLPGWHVEDLFDSSSSSPFGFCKSTGESDMMPFWDGGIDTNLSFFSPESTGLWVPQAATATTPLNLNPNQNQWFSATSNNISFGAEINTKEHWNSKPSPRKHWNNDDNIFAVPQISPPVSTTSSKRLRSLW